MNPILRNALAVIAGIVVGSIVNMGIIMISSTVIPPPAGADVTNIEGLVESMHLFEPKHFLMPFLAHALGTLAGAFICAILAATNKLKLALVIGLFFFAGGITNIYLLPSPAWFSIIDLIFAYFPMAWLGGKLAVSLSSKRKVEVRNSRT
jgi:hypothetical protein